MSAGSIMLPVQRQVPTALLKAAVSAGSGLGAGGPAPFFLAALGPFFFAGALSAFAGGPPFCAGATLVSSEGASTGFFSCAAAASEAARTNVGRVIDLLNERLAFERTGVRLYVRMLLRMRLTEDREMGRMIDRMQRYRDE